MTDKNNAEKPGWLSRLKKLLNQEDPPIEIEIETEVKNETKEITETKPVQPPLEEWRYEFLSLWIPDHIANRAKSYAEAQKFLARTDEENLSICEKKKQNIDHRFDDIAVWSFYGSISAICLGGLSLMFGGPVMFYAIVFGLGAGSSYAFDRLAHQVHLAEMEFNRQSMTEECDDRLNQYAYLLVDAVQYINAQIELWNMRVNYLLQKLAEPTEQDSQRCLELRAIHQDFSERIRRLNHCFALRQKEKNLATSGVELDRLHSRLEEHLADLKPIVPKISTDPLMLEAIQEMNAIFEEKPESEPENESVEITVEEDETK